jgi:hypothetical protein
MSLNEFTAAMVAHVMHERGWALEDATMWVLARRSSARGEYRALGAPLGDTDEGFVAWLQPRHQPLAA